MPNITNLHGAPRAWEAAAKNDPYKEQDRGHISTTQLIAPPQKVQLEIRHDAELERDVTDFGWSLLGQGVHCIIERGGHTLKGNVIVEKRFYAEMLGWRISGQIDLYEDGILWDNKVTKVWAWKNGPSFEWTAQGNVNRWLLEKNGIKVTGLKNWLLLKDWDKHQKAKSRYPYPERDQVAMELPMWGLNDTEEYIRTRVDLHQKSAAVADEHLPPCTAEETWEGRRCESFCSASPICRQFRKGKGL